MIAVINAMPSWWGVPWAAAFFLWAMMFKFRGLRRPILVPLAVAVVCVLPSVIASVLHMGEGAMPVLMLLGFSPLVVLAVTVLTLVVVAVRHVRKTE